MSPELEEMLYRDHPRIFRKGREFIGISCGDGWYNVVDVLCANIQRHIGNSRANRARDLRYNRALRAGIAGNKRPLEKHFNWGVAPFKVDAMVADRTDEAIASAAFITPNQVVRQVQCMQIKEKFGVLCFYYLGGDAYINGLVRMAEDISRHVCEKCGGRADAKVKSGWIKSLCVACAGK